MPGPCPEIARRSAMETEQLTWDANQGWQRRAPSPIDAGLVLYFGSNEALQGESWFEPLTAFYPNAHIVGCSTGGQIQPTGVASPSDAAGIDESGIAAVAMRFAATRLRVATETVTAAAESRSHAEALARKLLDDDLVAVYVLSDGLQVNGSDLVRGLTSVLGRSVRVSGGLAGDGARFRETRVGADAPPQPMTIAAIGFYGSAVRFGYGCGGGWDTFGVSRRITRSNGNELFELDGRPALDLYERYLGDEADGLPGTGLLYPLKIWHPEYPSHEVVRTVLAVNRQARSMTFAGDVPQGSRAQLMRGEFDRLAAGGAEAARQAALQHCDLGDHGSVALLVSCIGRKLLMGQRIEDEIRAVAENLPAGVARAGFYSYGEIAPHATSDVCGLHNQTMTVTLISEVLP
jgi:hypothetical protein